MIYSKDMWQSILSAIFGKNWGKFGDKLCALISFINHRFCLRNILFFTRLIRMCGSSLIISKHSHNLRESLHYLRWSFIFNTEFRNKNETPPRNLVEQMAGETRSEWITLVYYRLCFTVVWFWFFSPPWVQLYLLKFSRIRYRKN